MEEAGLPCGEGLIGGPEQACAGCRAPQTFGQVPAYEDPPDRPTPQPLLDAYQAR